MLFYHVTQKFVWNLITLVYFLKLCWNPTKMEEIPNIYIVSSQGCKLTRCHNDKLQWPKDRLSYIFPARESNYLSRTLLLPHFITATLVIRSWIWILQINLTYWVKQHSKSDNCSCMKEFGSSDRHLVTENCDSHQVTYLRNISS